LSRLRELAGRSETSEIERDAAIQQFEFSFDAAWQAARVLLRERKGIDVAWARRDRVLQLRRSRAAIRAIPNARLEVFGGGHAPFLECPDAFNAALERFLVSRPSAATAPRGSAAARGVPV
jgi:pimeloyl-ACP methyl ester carboxylesterase